MLIKKKLMKKIVKLEWGSFVQEDEPRSSCASRIPEVEEVDQLSMSQGPAQCYFLRPYEVQRIRVALGLVQSIITVQVDCATDHDVEAGHVCVLVDTVETKYENFDIPVPPPTHTSMTLVQAKSSFIQWPSKYLEIYSCIYMYIIVCMYMYIIVYITVYIYL